MQYIWPTKPPASFRFNVWAPGGHDTMTARFRGRLPLLPRPELVTDDLDGGPDILWRADPDDDRQHRSGHLHPGDLGPEVGREGQRGEVIAVSGGEVARDRGLAVPDR